MHQIVRAVNKLQRLLLFYVLFRTLQRALRLPVAGKLSTMALPSGPRGKPQNRTQNSPQWDYSMVYRRYSLQGMESDRLSSLGPWKMCVFSTILAFAAAYDPLSFSGLRKDHSLVRFLSVIS